MLLLFVTLSSIKKILIKTHILLIGEDGMSWRCRWTGARENWAMLPYLAQWAHHLLPLGLSTISEISSDQKPFHGPRPRPCRSPDSIWPELVGFLALPASGVITFPTRSPDSGLNSLHQGLDRKGPPKSGGISKSPGELAINKVGGGHHPRWWWFGSY